MSLDMEEEVNRDRRSWEEVIYWTHFQYFRFSRILVAGFDHRLAIPENFTRNLKSKLPDSVTLKSPCGASWEVSLTGNETTLFFDHGWPEFVKDHSLKENDILIFKYNGESHFEVLVFNGRNMCENVASYFLRKCGHNNDDNGCAAKRTNGQSSAEVVIDSSEEGIGGSLLKKPTNNEIYTTPLRRGFASQVVDKKAQRELKFKTPVCPQKGVRIKEPHTIPVRLPVNSRVVNKKARREIKSKMPIGTKKSARVKEPDTGVEDVQIKPDIEHTSSNPSNTWNTKERRKVLEMAQAALTNEGFIIVMKPTHVDRKFFMTIPTAWVTKHITIENREVILRIKENTWRTRLYYHKEWKKVGLSGGWKNFVLDNKLHEFDVCVFEPGGTVSNLMVLDVKIFRVVQ